MRIDSGARRRRPVSVTSLIDVIFLLLLFFMLSSTFTRFAEVEFSAGRAGALAPGKAPDVILRVSGEDWSVNGVRGDAQSALAELGRLEAAGARDVVLMPGGSLTSQELLEAIERVRRGTGLSLSVARGKR